MFLYRSPTHLDRVMDELREHGGQYVRESRMRKGYVSVAVIRFAGLR